MEKDKRFFLETEQGLPYANVFKALRLNHLVNHHMDMDMLLKDRIIPKKWMSKIYQCIMQTYAKQSTNVPFFQNLTREEGQNAK